VNYFSQRELGPPPRISEEITISVWQAIVAATERRVRDGSFGNTFPERCFEHNYTVGTDAQLFGRALVGAVASVTWPLNENEVPRNFGALDLIEFCYARVAQPRREAWHDYGRHYRLSFDVNAGRAEFRAEINGIFAGHGVAFDLNEEGQIVRLAPPEVQQVLNTAVFTTGDADLNRLLNTARAKFLRPRAEDRLDGLEKLVDAWERIKTLEDPNDKRRSITLILDRCAGNPTLRELLENQALCLTNAGNSFMIRHHEVNKVPLENSEQVDFLFEALFALVYYVLRSTGRAA
jgi:hypothetical protein